MKPNRSFCALLVGLMLAQSVAAIDTTPMTPKELEVQWPKRVVPRPCLRVFERFLEDLRAYAPDVPLTLAEVTNGPTATKDVLRFQCLNPGLVQLAYLQHAHDEKTFALVPHSPSGRILPTDWLQLQRALMGAPEQVNLSAKSQANAQLETRLSAENPSPAQVSKTNSLGPVAWFLLGSAAASAGLLVGAALVGPRISR
jgi:hypothetical protein